MKKLLKSLKVFWRLLTLQPAKKKFDRKSIIQELSISNDEVAVLAERLEFFLPRFETFIFIERVIYIFIWSLLFSMMQYKVGQSSFRDVVLIFTFEFCWLILATTFAFTLIDRLRSHFKRLSLGYACLQIWILIQLVGSLALISISFIYFILNQVVMMDEKSLLIFLFLHAIIIAFASILMLSYYLIRYHELMMLSDSFELKLEAQNELIKSRISSHFFFNTVNVLSSLVETDPPKAVKMLQNIATFFRVSFDDVAEIGLNEEIDLCHIFLAINETRFQDKVVITWDVPEEDIMYDMMITGLTLQSVLEKALYYVAEFSTETIHVHVTITWKNHFAEIIVKVSLPRKTLLIRHDLNQYMNFDIQERRLKLYFGYESKIKTQINKNNMQVIIAYPLHEELDTEQFIAQDINDMFEENKKFLESDTYT